MSAGMSASADDANRIFRMTWDCIRSALPEWWRCPPCREALSVKRVPARERERWHQYHAMLKLEWNALRVGDKVLAHDASDDDLRRFPGRRPGGAVKGSIDIGIRVAEGYDVCRAV